MVSDSGRQFEDYCAKLFADATRMRRCVWLVRDVTELCRFLAVIAFRFSFLPSVHLTFRAALRQHVSIAPFRSPR